MILKIVGILLILFSCSCAGIIASNKVHERVTILHKIRRMLDEMSTLIRYRSLTLSEMLSELSLNSEFKELAFLNFVKEKFIDGKEFYLAWESGIKSDINVAYIKDELISIGNVLGTSDTEGQLSALDIHKSRIDEMILKSEQEYASKGKLYRSLGILCGVFITIVLL